MAKFLRRLWYALRQPKWEAELAEEMAFHREMAREHLERTGAAPADAQMGAHRLFGSASLARDRARDVWFPPPLQDITGDVRLASRQLLRDRGFTVAAAITLALGIGTAGTIFTIFNGMFLKGLPVERPNQIVSVRAMDRQGRPLQLSLPQFDDWSTTTRNLRGLAAYSGASVVFDDDASQPERVPATYVSANLFDVIGERPLRGRGFAAADDRHGAPPVIVLGERIWRDRYGADPQIVGRSIRVNGEPITVVGVMPARFRFPVIDNAWLALGMAPQARDRKRDARTLTLVARLKDGVTISEARAELDTIAGRLEQAYPDTDRGVHTDISRYTYQGSRLLGDPWSDSLLAAGLLLLIGCANVATLLLARATGRVRDLAIRAALGATRWRILRQLLVESTLLSMSAAGLGFLLTWSGVQLWRASLPETNWPYWFRWDLDARVLAFIAAATASTAVLSGLAPAVQLSRVGPGALMKDDVRSGTAGRWAHRWTSVLLAGELAVTLVLLAGAGLMVRTTVQLLQVDRTVDVAHVLLSNVQMPTGKYSTANQRVRFVEELGERLEAQPGIRFTTVANAMPFYTAPLRGLTVEGRPDLSAGPPIAVSSVTIGTHYFDTLGVSVLRGRPFLRSDGTAGHFAAIVNQRFVQMFFGDAPVLGARIRTTDPSAEPTDAPWLTIVGVVPSVPQHYGQDLDPVVYVPYQQAPTPVPVVLVRSSGNPNTAVPLLRRTVSELDATAVLSNVMTLEQLLDVSGFANRVFLSFFSTFATLALFLSSVGLFAATRHSVEERRHEIGVRMALGARAGAVVWLFAGRTLRVLGVGGVLGLAGAVAATRVMRGFLVQTSPSDPLTLVCTVLLLALVAMAATVLPARRATRVDPAVVLRCD